MSKVTWLRESRIGQWAAKRPVLATAAVGATAWFFGAELLAAAIIGGAVTMLLRKPAVSDGNGVPTVAPDPASVSHDAPT